MVIKVISLWQPWAWAMWECLKQWETRDSWAPVVAQLRRYRGPLGIQAAKKEFHFSDYSDDFISNFRENCAGIDLPPEMTTKQFEASLSYGVLGGICNFQGEIFRTQHAFMRISDQERFWGNYEPERRAIHCPKMVKLPQPIPMRGHQSLFDFELPYDIERMLSEAWA